LKTHPKNQALTDVNSKVNKSHDNVKQNQASTGLPMGEYKRFNGLKR
jgi:hypothetical protein